jgi:hypothetical protein
MRIDVSDVIGFLLLAPIVIVLWSLALFFVWEIVGVLL